jgi:BirA family transcriptional regulator, biotin operon repressor / biotin---[acetyl-CoA-carboxylase] ligase
MREWLGTSVEAWRQRWGIPVLQVHERLDSTNDLARALAEQGAPAGTTIIAEEQARGRGRRGRDWLATPGHSILLSMILRPTVPGTETLLSLRLGIATARAMERAAPVQVGLKWPNDLLIRHRKVAGILCEAAGEPGRDLYVVAGIGINVHQEDRDWPPELAGEAISVEEAAGVRVDRGRLAGELVDAWLGAARRTSSRLDADELDEFHRRDLLRGQPLQVDGEAAGIGQGIDPDGALRAGEPGEPRRVIAGTVRTRHLQTRERS